MHILISAVLGASGGAILVVFVWIFLGAGIPNLSLPWCMLSGALIGGVLAGLGTWHSLVLYERRLEANRDYAARLRMQFLEKPASMDWPKTLAEGVHSGTRDAWQHHWQGQYAGLPIDVVDVRFTVETSAADGGSSSRTQEQTVYVWDLQQFEVPAHSVNGQGWGVAVAAALLGNHRVVSFDASKLPGHRTQIVREFNRRFVVQVSQNNEELAVRRLWVPDVMQALMSLGNVRLLADQGRLAFWWPGVLTSGSQRQERLEQTRHLVKALVSAGEDHKAELLPAKPDAHTDAMLSMLPIGCAVGMATPGFFLGGIAAMAVVIRQGGDVPMFLFPLSAFGLLIVFGAIGWTVGWVISRSRSGA
jgi:hypothetical protein